MFNLIDEPWVPVLRADGSRDRVSPAQVAAGASPAVDIDATRPDFRGACYQFCIGLLQSCYVPRDEIEWRQKLRKPPSEATLTQAFAPVHAWFDLDDPVTPFMQEPGLAKEENAWREPTAGLLISAPGDKTRKENKDIFVRHKASSALCGTCAASALYTLQVNSPAGGAGVMTSIRGGGPLTTIPKGRALWETIWLAVLPETLWKGDDASNSWMRFPWTGKPSKSGTVTRAAIHPDHHYWAMPRRILLDAPAPGTCSLCGATSNYQYHSYRSMARGLKYEQPFAHPLTPMRKGKDGEFTEKGRSNLAAYRNFVGIVTGSQDGGRLAPVVAQFHATRHEHLGDNAVIRVWAFGYAMDNDKVEGWYEGEFPVIEASDPPALALHAERLVKGADHAAQLLRGAVRDARLGETKGDLSIFTDPFWAVTAAAFYANLREAAMALSFTDKLQQLRDRWRFAITDAAVAQFDILTRQRNVGDGRPERVFAARKKLTMNLRGTKMQTILHVLPIPGATA